MIQSALLSLALMDAYMPALAPLVVLAFLGAGFVVVCTAVAAGVAYAARRGRLAALIGASGVVAAAGYAALLAGASLLSRDRTLSPGEHKYFCEMDCHIAYDVMSVETSEGGRRAVTLRTWFDPSTIAPFRGDSPLTPGPRTVYLLDDAGRRWEPAPAATEAWQRGHGGSAPLGRALRPGESYTTTLVFEAPADANARLFVGDAPGGPERLLIGHENSPFHGKTYFALPAPARAAR